MKVILISFAAGDQKWYRSQSNLVESSKNKSIDGYISYNESNLEKSYKEKYKNILNRSHRGYGYWMWKSHILQTTFNNLNDDDIILYVDTGLSFLHKIDYLINECIKNDVVLFINGDHLNKKWTKRDAYVIMDCDNETYYNAPQVDASIQLYKKSEYSKTFLDEFSLYSENVNVISDLPNIKGDNLPEFVDHRHDQSILSILAKKYNIKLLTSPTQYGNHVSDRPYVQLFHHHRGVF